MECGGGYLWGQSMGGRTLVLGRERTLAPPPPPAAQPRARASLPAEAPRHPGVWRGARLPAPTPPLRGSEPAARLSQTNRGGDRVAPTRICDSSCRRPQSSQDGALGPLAWRVRAEPGTREEPPPTRQRVPGQCAARSLQAALGETLVCRIGCREEGTKGSARGPAASAPGLLGPGSPHFPRTLTLQCPERRGRPGANRGTPGCRGLSRDCGPPSRALQQLRLGPRRDAGFASSASPRQGVDEAARGRGMSGRILAGTTRARVVARARAGRRVRLGRVSAGAPGGGAVGGAGCAWRAG